MKIAPKRLRIYYEFLCRKCGTQFTAGNTPEDIEKYSYEEFFAPHAGCFYAKCDCPECGEQVYSVLHCHVDCVERSDE